MTCIHYHPLPNTSSIQVVQPIHPKSYQHNQPQNVQKVRGPSPTLHLPHDFSNQLILRLSSINRFHPKDDVASSSFLKSSAQRHIRSSLIDQISYLSLPLGGSSESALRSDEQEPEPEVEVEEPVQKSGKGGKKGGGGGKGSKKEKEGKSGGGGKNKEEKKEKEEQGESTDDKMTIIEEIWPKKEALGVTKWYVLSMRISLSDVSVPI